jgi:hypothetical protein
VADVSFGLRTAIAAGGDRIYVAQNDRWETTAIGSNGRPVLKIRRQFVPRRAEPRDVEKLTEVLLDSYPNAAQRRRREKVSASRT